MRSAGLAARQADDVDLRRLWPAVLLRSADERQRAPIRRPARAAVADAARQGPGRLAAVGTRDPDAGIVLVLLFVGRHPHEGDLRSIGRDLRIGHPHEREQVLLGDSSPLARIGLRGQRSQGNDEQQDITAGTALHKEAPLRHILVPRISDTRHKSRAAHPGWRRCDSRPLFPVVAPCHPGAALRNLCHVSLIRGH